MPGILEFISAMIHRNWTSLTICFSRFKFLTYNKNNFHHRYLVFLSCNGAVDSIVFLPRDSALPAIPDALVFTNELTSSNTTQK